MTPYSGTRVIGKKSRAAEWRGIRPGPSAGRSGIPNWPAAPFLALAGPRRFGRGAARAYLNTVLMTNAAMKIVAAIMSNPPMISLFKVPLR